MVWGLRFLGLLAAIVIMSSMKTSAQSPPVPSSQPQTEIEEIEDESEQETTRSGITLSELLPDPGDLPDSEGEFIELFNPNEYPVDISGYVLQSGSDFQYDYVFVETVIDEFLVVYSVNSDLVLSNSGSKVRLIDLQGNVISETEYPKVKSDEVWTLIEEEWVLSDRSTPGEENILPDIEEEAEVENEEEIEEEKTYEPCPEGKFRNPETNRCKNIETDESILKPCLVNQYRNPETNRCKLITSTTTTLKPCAPDQIRNPLTNRCKKFEVAGSTLKPCAEGQERNPETNRCRKVLGASTTEQPAQVSEQEQDVSYLAMGSVTAGASLYAIWEYRKDILLKLRRRKSPV